MRICIQKSTGKLIEMQSDATEGTLIQNAVDAGFPLDDIEEREITPEEWADPNAPWNQPSDEALQAQAEATRQALFAENDKPLMMYMRRLFAGDETARAGFEACNAYAEALRAMNDTPGWYKDPQWPPKPEI